MAEMADHDMTDMAGLCGDVGLRRIVAVCSVCIAQTPARVSSVGLSRLPVYRGSLTVCPSSLHVYHPLVVAACPLTVIACPFLALVCHIIIIIMATFPFTPFIVVTTSICADLLYVQTYIYNNYTDKTQTREHSERTFKRENHKYP